MGRAAALIVAALFAVSGWAQQAPMDATTASGEKVKLHPDGRWEYADPVKAEPQRKAREAAETEMRERDRNSQGGLFGIGRTIPPGDKDYNRGSLGRR
jgi:hypothetical protein